MSALLIHEPPLQVLPSLAVAIGLNEAIVLQQIHYWMARTDNVINGHKWVYNSIAKWREQFPFWSDDTIGRSIKSLRDKGLVIAEKLSPDPFDKSLYYRIDYGMVPESITATCGNRDTQVAAISIQRLRTESTADTTRARKRATPAAAVMVPVDVDEQIWVDWLAHRKVKKATVTETVISQHREQAKLAGVTLAEAMAHCCSAGWQGFRADWYLRDCGGAAATRQQRQRNGQPVMSKDTRDAEAMRLLGFADETTDVIEA